MRLRLTSFAFNFNLRRYAKGVGYILALIIAFMAVTRGASAVLGARHAAYRTVSNAAVQSWDAARVFAPLDHGGVVPVATHVETVLFQRLNPVSAFEQQWLKALI